jgi:uncharacterized phage protein (TIGR01671 family)
MYRFIAFRGKRVDNGKYVYGSLITSKNKYFIRVEEGEGEYGHKDMFEVFEDTVGQATGLTDKNGKMIYENDLLIFTNKNFTRIFKCVFAKAKREVHTLPDYESNGEPNIIEINGWGFELVYTSEYTVTVKHDVLFPNNINGLPDYKSFEILNLD